MNGSIPLDPKRDLVLERVIDLPQSVVWEMWTKPEHVKVWFCPRPWSVSSCEMDLRPGGIFQLTMRSPDGDEFTRTGCFLEVDPQKRLTFTTVLLPGYRPASADDLPFTATISLEVAKGGTRYLAMALHRDEMGCEKHMAIGFHDGWGKALDQLVAHAKSLP